MVFHSSLETSVDLQSSSTTIPERERVVSETSEGSLQELGSEAVSMEMLARYMKALWSFMSESKEETDGGSREEWREETGVEDIYPVEWRGMNMRVCTVCVCMYVFCVCVCVLCVYVGGVCIV